jgi:hypothetical protein
MTFSQYTLASGLDREDFSCRKRGRPSQSLFKSFFLEKPEEPLSFTKSRALSKHLFIEGRS